MTLVGLRQAFEGKGYAEVVLEAGGQSAWVTRELQVLGYDPVVANPRKLKAISGDGELREYVMSHYLVLYARFDATIYLLSIRHHRQLSFDFESLWAGTKTKGGE